MVATEERVREAQQEEEPEQIALFQSRPVIHATLGIGGLGNIEVHEEYEQGTELLLTCKVRVGAMKYDPDFKTGKVSLTHSGWAIPESIQLRPAG